MIGYFRKAIAAKRPAILNERNRLGFDSYLEGTMESAVETDHRRTILSQ
jgi:hypothetical protein